MDSPVTTPLGVLPYFGLLALVRRRSKMIVNFYRLFSWASMPLETGLKHALSSASVIETPPLKQF
jgi:hypothetical protein